MKDFVKPSGGLYSAPRGCDVVLDIRAGDSFADIYGARRIGTQLGAKFLTLLARRPLILCPQTVGPLKSALWRQLSRAVIARAAGVATRDDLSTAFLREIGYRGEIVEATDVAMRLPYTPPETRDDGVVRVGINVSGLLYFGGYTRDNMFGLKVDYPRLMSRIAAHFSAMEGVELHLVGHVLADPDADYSGDGAAPDDDPMAVEDDLRACHLIGRDHPQARIAPLFRDPSAAKTYIAGLDFFMGARMHACIAAFSSGVPVIPMAYSRKFKGLFGTLGYDRTLDCMADDEETILTAVADGFDAREALKREVAAAMARSDARLDAYEALLSRIMQAAA